MGGTLEQKVMQKTNHQADNPNNSVKSRLFHEQPDRVGSGPTKMLQKAEYRRKQVFTDVTLVAEAQEVSPKPTKEVRIPAYKIDLLIGSSYFKEILLRDPYLSELRVPAVDSNNLSAFVRHIYEEEKVCPTEASVERLYLDALYLGMSDILRIVLDFLIENINIQTWAKRLNFSRTVGNNELGERIIVYIRSNFKACIQSQGFHSLNATEIAAVLRLRNKFRIDYPEHEIMAHISSWIMKLPGERATFSSLLLGEVNLVELDDEIIHKYFTSEPFLHQIAANKLYQDTLLEKQGLTFRPKK